MQKRVFVSDLGSQIPNMNKSQQATISAQRKKFSYYNINT